MRFAIVLALMGLCAAACADFSLEDNGAALTVREGGAPVLVYNYGMVEPPAKVDTAYRRACYIHPLYGLDGEVMTQDFPLDHRHHRGVFWAWPGTTIGGRKADIWIVNDGIRQRHEDWIAKEASADHATIAAHNVWVYDDAPDAPQVRETVSFTVHPADGNARAIDFDLAFENLTQEVIVIGGAETDNKGYGGFCFRPDATRKPLTFTAPQGVLDEDKLELDAPWVDVVFATEKNGEKVSGAAIFQHPGNPREYPYPGWITRAYGFLGCSWPHTRSHEMQPGERFRLRYRLFLHRGTAAEAQVAEAFAAYRAANEGK